MASIDWVITNPPFNLAYPMLLKSLLNVRVGVAFLLRLSFVEPTNERGDWLEKNPPTGRITLPRYSFTGDGRSDSVTAEWMIWYKHRSHTAIQSYRVENNRERMDRRGT